MPQIDMHTMQAQLLASLQVTTKTNDMIHEPLPRELVEGVQKVLAPFVDDIDALEQQEGVLLECVWRSRT